MKLSSKNTLDTLCLSYNIKSLPLCQLDSINDYSDVIDVTNSTVEMWCDLKICMNPRKDLKDKTRWRET